tara:strand:- start:264 stop:1841 length:1578 start_codon:yes stop_codon:yes gene_type:complete
MTRNYFDKSYSNSKFVVPLSPSESFARYGISNREPMAKCWGRVRKSGTPFGPTLYEDGTIEGMPYRNVNELVSVRLVSKKYSINPYFNLRKERSDEIESVDSSEISSAEDLPKPGDFTRFRNRGFTIIAVQLLWLAIWIVPQNHSWIFCNFVIFGCVFSFLLLSLNESSAGSELNWLSSGSVRYSTEIQLAIKGETEIFDLGVASEETLRRRRFHEWVLASSFGLFIVNFVAAVLEGGNETGPIELVTSEKAMISASAFFWLFLTTSTSYGFILKRDWLESLKWKIRLLEWDKPKRNRHNNWKKVPIYGAFDFYSAFTKKINENSGNEMIGQDILELLAANESQYLEFKGSVWTKYDPRDYSIIDKQSKKSMQLQDSVVKTIAAFLNTDGGTLLIGVADKPRDEIGTLAEVVGIENDFKWLKKGRQDREGYVHALQQLLSDAFDDESIVSMRLKILFPEHQGLTICRIDVTSLPRVINGELYVKTKTMGPEEFFFRASDTTTHASVKSANRYIRHHFEGFSRKRE